tara:strand:- start:121 stop:1119 length:999 start_codon:yes stop_codon:yes gene_type:complete
MFLFFKFTIAITLVTFFLIKISRYKFFNFIYDKPDNKRKFHLNPTPLIGGIIIFIDLLIFNYFFEKNLFSFFNFFLFLFPFFILGFVDDIFNLNAYLKLLFLILLISFFKEYFFFDKIFFYEFGIIQIGNYLNQIFIVLCILVFINSTNMLDGIDGAAITYFMSITIFLLINNIEENKNFLICLLIIYSSLLIFNLNKKIFLGDSGIYLSAILFSYLIIEKHNLGHAGNFKDNIFYAENIFLIMLLPGIDMVRLFILRLLKKQSPLKADRNHFHHMLLSKYNDKISILIMNLFYFLPLLSSLFLEINKFIIILLWLYIYVMCIIYLKNAKSN